MERSFERRRRRKGVEIIDFDFRHFFSEVAQEYLGLLEAYYSSQNGDKGDDEENKDFKALLFKLEELTAKTNNELNIQGAINAPVSAQNPFLPKINEDGSIAIYHSNEPVQGTYLGLVLNREVFPEIDGNRLELHRPHLMHRILIDVTTIKHSNIEYVRKDYATVPIETNDTEIIAGLTLDQPHQRWLDSVVKEIRNSPKVDTKLLVDAFEELLTSPKQRGDQQKNIEWFLDFIEQDYGTKGRLAHVATPYFHYKFEGEDKYVPASGSLITGDFLGFSLTTRFYVNDNSVVQVPEEIMLTLAMEATGIRDNSATIIHVPVEVIERLNFTQKT